MRRLIETIKDIIYDYIDYFIIIIVVFSVSVLIGWRLPQLFASGLDKQPINDSENIIVVSENIDNNSENNDSKTEDNENENITEDNENTLDENKNLENSINNNEEEIKKSSNEKIIITVEIPKGSLGPKIAQILKDKGLINDTTEFLKRAKELKLDTKLQSGKFNIEEGSTLDNIIKIVSRQI